MISYGYGIVNRYVRFPRTLVSDVGPLDPEERKTGNWLLIKRRPGTRSEGFGPTISIARILLL